MKKIIFVSLVLVLNVLTACITYAQENYRNGYIVDVNNDTITGFINYRNWGKNPKHISFKESLKNEAKSFFPTNIHAFEVEGEAYRSAIVKVDEDSYSEGFLTYNKDFHFRVDTAFLQVLVQGDKNLYRYKDVKGKEHFFIGKGTEYELLLYKKYYEDKDEVKEVKSNNQFLRQLAAYLIDCKDIYKELENVKYSQSSLLSLFSAYSRCTGVQPHYQSKEEKTKVNFGGLAGLSSYKLRFKGVNNDELVNSSYTHSENPVIGLFIDMTLPRAFAKWSFYNELLYTSCKVNGHYSEYVNVNSYSDTYIRFGYTFLKINNMLRFNHSLGNVPVFFNAGISNGFALNEDNYKKVVTIFYDTEKVEEDKALSKTRKYEIGYLAGIGSKYKRFSFELRWEAGTGMAEYVDLNSPTNRLSFLVGYQF